MGIKKTFLLRLDPAVLAAIETWAVDEFRSSQGQLEWIITQALKAHSRYPVSSTDVTDGKAVKESNEELG